MYDLEIQTEDPNAKKRKSSGKQLVIRQNSIRATDNIQAQNSIDSYNEELSSKRRKKKKKLRGKVKNTLYTQIHEEEDDLSLGEDEDTERQFLKTA